ncbi:hypothetical protein CONPUDRAFT_82804 [Coniophora puteana RWD-64-598 SS2]|uniref:Uncharacterized protein n=1 Tax=Coniophora puteana (strain RWD-64-598) TaxID=741705 RepID=A0A5M3MNV9_CONPW|nr:uncharacterized protein CONPUDRAFT_82804 [Coniophora puteana RWD-64-598 SS2]EIW80700.1 hypothetical protein CONPUDRAFT_82804 [Coniophora puteana RWD-64-598 SS2]
MSSSPVTRSNCRFHKISLPKEEGGPRMCFVVPGCSLGDKELMDEEEIEDHGPATYEDYRQLLGNIELLDCFSSDLIGVLRQLVGVDLLRENEVFYLVQPGEEALFKKRPKKSRSRRESRKSLGLSRGLSAIETSSVMGRSAPNSPSVSKLRHDDCRSSLVPPSIRPPDSKAESALSSAPSIKNEEPHDSHESIASSSKPKAKSHSSRGQSMSASASSYALSDYDGEGDDEDGEGAKPGTEMKKDKTKASLQKRTSSVKSADGGSGAIAKKKKERPAAADLVRRRSKRLHPDAAAYQPRAQEEEESSEDEILEARRRKRTKKGTKRSLADGEENGDSHRAKKPRKTGSVDP